MYYNRHRSRCRRQTNRSRWSEALALYSFTLSPINTVSTGSRIHSLLTRFLIT